MLKQKQAPTIDSLALDCILKMLTANAMMEREKEILLASVNKTKLCFIEFIALQLYNILQHISNGTQRNEVKAALVCTHSNVIHNENTLNGAQLDFDWLFVNVFNKEKRKLTFFFHSLKMALFTESNTISFRKEMND